MERGQHLLLVLVQRLQAVDARGGEGEALRIAVNEHDAVGAARERAVRGEDADGPGAPDGHIVACADARELAAVPAGREDVGEEQRRVLGHARRELQQVDVRERDAHDLGLRVGLAGGEWISIY